MSLLAATVVGLPLLAGVLLGTALRRARPSVVRYLALAATGLTVLCALLLLSHTGDDPLISIEWLPGAGAMGLTASASGLYAVLATTGAAFLTLLGCRSHSAAALLALGAANVAFLADHFLARYVALEMAALCVALVPLSEVPAPASTRLTWTSYLLLRVGDAGLLVAILVLGDAAGTYAIAPALAAGEGLEGGRLWWMVAGFILAVWVKLGGWPFHLWVEAGSRLSLASQAWLYATLLPNLGIYLLYRVTPLLALAGPLRAAALWLGAGGATLAALLALTQADLRDAMVYVGAAQGGLVLFVAAAGVRPAVWLGLLVWTPVRLLLFLAADVARRMGSPRWRGVGAGLFGLGGSTLAAYSLLIAWWARGLAGLEMGPPLDVVFVAEVAAALLGVWAVRATWRLALGLTARPEKAESGAPPDRVEVDVLVTTGVLGIGVLVGALVFGPLARYLTAASHLASPPLPDMMAFLRYVVTAPALLVVAVLALAAWRLQRRVGWESPLMSSAVEEGYDLAEGLSRAAQALRAVVEVGLAERLVALVVRAVVNGARLAWAVEHRGLDDLVDRTAGAVTVGARTMHRIVEGEGLEGLLRRVVYAVLALSRCMQRFHTGRLRRNLLWLPAVLVAVVLALITWGW